MVVDDSATNRLFLAMLLEQQGFEPSCHARWSEAEPFACTSQATALILDCWLAQEDSAAIIRDLRNRSNWRDRPILVIADPEGAVRRSFIGEPTATDLWAALAELREPGSVPPSCTHD